MAMNTSSKFNNILFKVLLHSGSPTVYQLTPKKEDVGRLTRFTLGDKDPEKTNKTILLVGETGTGKSALVNALVNYAMGVTWEDDVWFQMEDECRRQSQSQKSEVVVYQVFGFEGKTLPYSLTIVDTPGYGDTRGIEHDDIISQQLLDLFRSEDGVHEVNAVGLVLKASVNRLSDRLRYVFDATLSLFGKDLEKNIVALVTHSDGRTPINALNTLKAAKVKCAKDEKNQPVHFLFDNCQHQDRTEEAEGLQHAHGITAKGMKQFSHFVGQTEAQNLETTVSVLKERIRLSASIQNLQERVELIGLQQREIQQTQESLREYEEEMKENQNFTVEVDEAYREREAVRGRATCCTICEENCHYPGCTVALYPECCAVMRFGRCTVCTGKCHMQYHVKENWIYVNKVRKVQKIDEDVRREYERNKAERESKMRVLEKLHENLEEPQKHRDQDLEESFQHVVRLQQIALQADSLSTAVHLDVLSEQMRERGDTQKLQKLEEMRRRLDKGGGARGGLRYMSA